jgi:oxygen-independent coproporphyrinogen-3 oxidase
LTKNGYKHYEISNYAKPGYESIHNKNYWLNGSYYGFGLGAVSYLNNTRINNTKNLTKYLSGNYLSNSIYEDEKVRKENTLMLGLRLVEGISIDNYNREYHEDLLSKNIIKELINDKYLEVSGDMLKVNTKYLYTENEILIKLLDKL